MRENLGDDGRIADANSGDRTTVTVLRDGERLKRKAVLGKPRRSR